MTFRSPFQLGQLMGLSSDGTALSDRNAIDQSALDAEGELWKTTGQPNDTYWAEFSSLYLLSLVRTLVQLGAPSMPPHSVAMSKCMLTKPAHPTSARLMRQHTGLALSLYQLVVADLCHSVNGFVPVRDCDIPWPRVPIDDARALAKAHLVAMISLLNMFSVSLPSEVRLPSLSAHTRAQLQAACVRVSGDTTTRVLWEKDPPGPPLEYHLRTVQDVASQDADFLLAQPPLASSAAPWVSCQVKVEAFPDPARSACVSLGPDQKLMACSRCQTVRYCSRDHQKADWKRHKQFCFKPTW